MYFSRRNDGSMHSQVTIRAAVPGDAGAIADVHLRSWMTAYRGIIADDFLDRLMDSYPDRVRRWEGILTGAYTPSTATFLSEVAGTGLVGFVSCGPTRSVESTYPGELFSIYILGDFRGRGIGRQLMQQCAGHLRALGIGRYHLWVLEANPARRFYEAMGGAIIPGWSKELVIGGTAVTEVAYGWPQPPEDGLPAPDA
jgi:GNAT superfamily N-acetyltransferase